MSDAPLYDAVAGYAERDPLRLHMPAHSGRAAILRELCGAAALDVTELPDTDSLFEAKGAILRAERLAAEYFGCGRCLISAGGSTLCIQTMLALIGRGKKIICARNAHRSAINAMLLLCQTPVWLMGDGGAGDGLFGRIDPRSVESALAANPDAAAVYVTSPDYYGVLCDIPAIAEVCRRACVPLLADGAHGAHLKALGPDAFRGADMYALSAHKTLPALTGGAWLCVNGRRFERDAKSAMALFGSTSPSYLIMTALDLCRAWLCDGGGRAFAELAEKTARVKAELCRMGYSLPRGDCDPVRLAVRTAERGVDGTSALRQLAEMGIEAEYADREYVVMIPTPFLPDDWAERVIKAFADLRPSGVSVKTRVPPEPMQALPMSEAAFCESEVAAVEESVGRVSGDTVSVCPPCVPIAAPGEVITREIAEILLDSGISEIKVVK